MTSQDSWPVVELRQYTLRPGKRDTLIELFDREFVETQEACGIRVLGQFRDDDDPDRFVWLRAFRDLDDRTRALTEFYVDGEAWRTHAPAARETMLDTDDALLLRPLTPFPPPEERPAAAHAGTVVHYENRSDRPGAVPTVHTNHRSSRSRIAATVYHLNRPAETGFAEFFATGVVPVLTATGAEPIAVLVTDPSPNTFPRLPLRTGEHVLVWFAAFDDADELADHRDRLAEHPEWTRAVLPELERHLAAPTRSLRLAPTSRSTLR